VFRSFSHVAAGDQQVEFRFRWLWNLPFACTYDARRGVLSFPNLLPHIPAGSEMDTGLKAFIRSCCSSDRPAHRRIDPAQLSVRCSNRRGTVSLAARIAGGDHESGVRKTIQLVNEIFLGFLSTEHPQYLVEHFQIPEE